MTDPQTTNPRQAGDKYFPHVMIGVFVLALLMVGSCGAMTGWNLDSNAPASSSAKTYTPACEHFMNVIHDLKAGILTRTELRTKIAEVRDSATNAEVKGAATTMLAAITRGDDAGTRTAADQVKAACDRTAI